MTFTIWSEKAKLNCMFIKVTLRKDSLSQALELYFILSSPQGETAGY